jgi:Zn-dependent peptidase ImmA (M78 family)/transcriptional regulator with XRE-family HTH domain
MDKSALGGRLADAREVAGMTQEGLGRAVSLDGTAIAGLEMGKRELNTAELISIANVLGRPLSYFVSPSVPAVVSRRSSPNLGHETTRELDIELEMFAADVRTLLEMKLITPPLRFDGSGTPNDHQAAEKMANDARSRLGMDSQPIVDLGESCQHLGLYAFSARLAKGGPDGACVEVDSGHDRLGAAVINGTAPPGRRRMTLAHELGHWLSGDAYDRQASPDSERMINSFAVHFLAPRAGVLSVWNQDPGRSDLDRALTVGAVFRLSWSATISQLKNLEIISPASYRALRDYEPRRGDYARLSLSWTDELGDPYVSPGFAASCLNAYVSGELTAHRVIELLRGILSVDDLPERKKLTLEDYRSAFVDHDA